MYHSFVLCTATITCSHLLVQLNPTLLLEGWTVIEIEPDSLTLMWNRCDLSQSHIPLRLYSLLFLVNVLWLINESCLPLAIFVIVLANTCYSCYLQKERICFSYCSSINHVFYLEDDWLIMSFCFKVASCSCAYLTRSILVHCSLSSLSPYHILSSLPDHDVDDWLWLQGQNQHKTTTKQIQRSPRKFSPNLERTGEDMVQSEDRGRSAK